MAKDFIDVMVSDPDMLTRKIKNRDANYNTRVWIINRETEAYAGYVKGILIAVIYVFCWPFMFIWQHNDILITKDYILKITFLYYLIKLIST